MFFKMLKLWGNGYPHSNMQEELFELLLWDEREREEKENNFIHLCYEHGDADKEYAFGSDINNVIILHDRHLSQFYCG